MLYGRAFKRFPKYPSKPAVQEPIVEDGMAVGWIMRMTIFKDDIEHTHEVEYTCEPDEIVEPFHPSVSDLLARIMAKLVNQHGFLDDCEAGLEDKLRAEGYEV